MFSERIILKEHETGLCWQGEEISESVVEAYEKGEYDFLASLKYYFNGAPSCS